MIKQKLPKYVWFGSKGSCAMRLTEDGKRYYRIAGDWGTAFKVDDGHLVSTGNPPSHRYLNNIRLIPCTFQEWKRDNKGYV